MARTGRPGKALELHRTDGTLRRDRHGDGVPAVFGERGEPEPPVALGSRERETWDMLLEARGGILETGEAHVLYAVVRLTEQALVARGHLRRHGYFPAGANTGFVKSPAIEVERMALAAMRPFLEKLGLSPSDRARLLREGVQAKSAAVQLEERVGRSAWREPPPGEGAEKTDGATT